jgi:Icc protein
MIAKLNRIAFITDLHLVLEGLANQIDTKANFLKLARSIGEWDIDHIICGGDLSFKEPRLEDVLFVKDILDQSKISYDVIRGNHDSSEDFQAVFGYQIEGQEIYFERIIAGRQCIFLDTKQGSISDRQCDWLQTVIEKDLNPLIFMHYPPVETGIRFMDTKHEFKDKEKVLDILSSAKKTLDIFCGHCHAERFIQYRNLNIHITPSAIMQVDERSEDFKIYHKFVGYRIIEYDNESNIRTFVKYLF